MIAPLEASMLRQEFPPAAIGKLPKGGTELDFVGHAAVTDRLLAVDPQWNWEPYATAADGGPLVRLVGSDAELWVRLTRGRDPLAATVDHLSRRLELIGLARIAADPGEGTWTLPAGRLSVGGGGIEKVWPDDLTALTTWAEKHCPDAVEPQPAKLNKNTLWAFLKDHAVTEEHKRQVPATESGEITVPDIGPVPGLTVLAKPRTVTPQPDTDAF